MATIIAATDFKSAADNAGHYACMLARAIGAEVIILHAQSIIGKLVDSGKEHAELTSKLNAVVTKYKNYYPDVEVTPKLMTGNVVEGLNDYMKHKGEPTFIVVGNNFNNEHPSFMDTRLLQVFKNLYCPVIAVPTGKTFETIKKICFAFDNHMSGARAGLKRLRNLCVDHNIELHILIGMSDVHNRDNLPEMHPEAHEILNDANPKLHFIRKDHLNEDIKSYAEKNHMGMLAILPRAHYGLSALVHKSHTQYMLNHAFLPILALHEE